MNDKSFKLSNTSIKLALSLNEITNPTESSPEEIARLQATAYFKKIKHGIFDTPQIEAEAFFVAIYCWLNAFLHKPHKEQKRITVAEEWL